MNLLDYIKKNGNKSFNDLCFNEIDNAILCQITYVSFENVININKPYTIEELSKLYFSMYTDKDIKKDKSLIARSPLVLRLMAKYKRYKNIVMHHFVYSSSEISSHQFAAMQFDLDDDTTYVSFRGTDDQILGWKEDFQMAYKKIPGYKYARKYINRYCRKNKKYRVGGHSKGGALAIYGSVNCFSFRRKNIIEVYSNDGPGIRKELIKDKMKLIEDKYIKIVPENDLFGVIFDDDNKHSVVKSSAIGPYQHDMLSWLIKGNEFVKAKALSSNSKKLRKNFNDYINNVPKDELISITNSLFDFLKDINITKVSDLFKISLTKVPDMLKKASNIDDSVKKRILKVIWVIVEANIPTISFSSDKMIINRGK